MAAGPQPTPSEKPYGGKLTWFVILASFVAASGGFIFGYDIGISGGVTSMDQFLAKFFPKVLLARASKNNYCQYDNQGLQLFTSSLYLAGLLATYLASWTTSTWGRKPSMIIGGVSFMAGATLNAAAQNLIMLIIGRILLGVGVGFGNQCVPLYLSEMAPSKHRGKLNIIFQLACISGILIANIINYFTGKIDWGWRLSLGLAIVPATILFIGGMTLPETPNSLIERNQNDAGRRMLIKIRGTEDVVEEYNDIVEASEKARAIKNPYRNLLTRKYRPHLTVATLIPFFQQVTGINAIMFYAPVLFRTVGFGSNAALLSNVITGGVNVAATIVSIIVVDKLGRRTLFLEGGVQMLVCQIAVGLMLKFKLPYAVGATMSSGMAWATMAVICIYTAAFSWSWGPLGWLVPSEVYPLEIRSAAQSVTVSTNFLFTFGIGQAFLSMLCNFKWGIFIFFAGWVLIMTLYVIYFLPETKNVPIEEMKYVWGNHRYWKNFAPLDDFDRKVDDNPTKPPMDNL